MENDHSYVYLKNRFGAEDCIMNNFKQISTRSKTLGTPEKNTNKEHDVKTSKKTLSNSVVLVNHF